MALATTCYALIQDILVVSRLLLQKKINELPSAKETCFLVVDVLAIMLETGK